MARTVYRVVPDVTKWSVKHERKIMSSHYTKSSAIEAGRGLAKANEPSQLVVHRSDGTIETEWTYGDDPFPPRG